MVLHVVDEVGRSELTDKPYEFANSADRVRAPEACHAMRCNIYPHDVFCVCTSLAAKMGFALCQTLLRFLAYRRCHAFPIV
eukprot:COSAG01_NODE_326_length_18790_cov_10.366005_14_plen_81_part_00